MEYHHPVPNWMTIIFALLTLLQVLIGFQWDKNVINFMNNVREFVEKWKI